MRYILLLSTLFILGCSSTPQSTALYKAKGNKKNTPYDNPQENDKELKSQRKKSKARQAELDEINNKNVERKPIY